MENKYKVPKFRLDCYLIIFKLLFNFGINIREVSTYNGAVLIQFSISKDTKYCEEGTYKNYFYFKLYRQGSSKLYYDILIGKFNRSNHSIVTEMED